MCCFHGADLKVSTYLALLSFSSSMMIGNVPKRSSSVSLGYGEFWREENIEHSYNQPSVDTECEQGINFCRYEPLSLGGYLLLQHNLA